MRKRALSDEFFKCCFNGTLNPLVNAVQEDDTLDMELRGNYVNIYYRGGSLYKIIYNKGKISITFDTKYDINDKGVLGNISLGQAVDLIPTYKQVMDVWFRSHFKNEREYEQNIVRENNRMGKVSASTDYYITDVEYVYDGARIDLVAVKWPSISAIRKKNDVPTLVFIELKHGDGALNGKSGLKKHLDDFNRILGDGDFIKGICSDMSEIFKQKCQLRLIDEMREHQFGIKINEKVAPEIIIIPANHDPAKSVLKTELTDALNEIKQNKYPNIKQVRVAFASTMGYGLYEENIIPLEDSLKRL